MQTSLIISTYNWPEALHLVLRSVLIQTILPTEVIIADDGSRDDTRKLIEDFQQEFPVPLIHVWHEDKGFRLAEIRNKAIQRASCEYIIQIDGDVILSKRFISDHIHFAQKNCFITGSRVLLDEKMTEEALKNEIYHFSCLTPRLRNRPNAIRFPLFNSFIQLQNQLLKKLYHGIRGCNMSFWRQDLIDINGYDENFVGWGREDSDIVIRLVKKGVFKKKIKFAAIQFHLYHKENNKNMLDFNHHLLEKALPMACYKAKNGIEKL